MPTEKNDGKTRRCQEMMWGSPRGFLTCRSFVNYDDGTKCEVHSEAARKKRDERRAAKRARRLAPGKRIEELERLLGEARDLHDKHCAIPYCRKPPWKEN